MFVQSFLGLLLGPGGDEPEQSSGTAQAPHGRGGGQEENDGVGLAVEEVAEGGDGVYEEHAGTGVAHYVADLLAVGGEVAVDGTALAGRLTVAVRATA